MRPYTPGTYCQDWDSDKPQYLTDKRTGDTFGRLMPRISNATLESSPGIQPWSHPRGKVSTELFDGGATILAFSEYWERKWQKTYPYATED